MAKELKIGGWYYRMMGYGGSESQYCCIMGKTGERTSANMFSMFTAKGAGLQPIPVSDIYIALDERGVEHRVSANDLKDNDHIGIGTLTEDESGHKASIYREDAALLVETGRYTKEEIEAEFPYAFKSYDEEEEEDKRPSAPMTEKQAEMLKAAHEEDVAKEKREAEEAARKFKEAVEKVRSRYSFIPCPKTQGKYLRTGEVSRNLRAVLKFEFPGVKFSVNSDSFSGGDSATIRWVDGPDFASVNRIVDAFQGKRPDHTGDYWDFVPTAVTEVCGDFSYTFAERSYTPETEEYVKRYFAEHLYAGESWNDDREKLSWGEAHKLLKKTAFPVGGYEIEGIEYDDKKFEYVLKFKDKKQPEPPTPSDGGDGNGSAKKGEAYWKRNEAKKGIEIYFPSVPDEYTRQRLKANGWRWSKFNRCWYARFDEGTWEMARDVVMTYNEGRAAA